MRVLTTSPEVQTYRFDGEHKESLFWPAGDGSRGGSGSPAHYRAFVALRDPRDFPVASLLRSVAADGLWAGVEAEPATVNGRPAALLCHDGVIFAALSLSASADGIDQVMWTMNPSKLDGVGGPATP